MHLLSESIRFFIYNILFLVVSMREFHSCFCSILFLCDAAVLQDCTFTGKSIFEHNFAEPPVGAAIGLIRLRDSVEVTTYQASLCVCICVCIYQ